jgi:hypothetical protein
MADCDPVHFCSSAVTSPAGFVGLPVHETYFHEKIMR